MFIAKKSIDTHIHIDTSKQEEAPVFKYFFTSEFFQNADFLFIWQYPIKNSQRKKIIQCKMQFIEMI